MALAVFYKVVLPILEVLLTVLIMISTLVDAWNFFSRTLDKGEEEMRSGKPRIVVFRQRLMRPLLGQKEWRYRLQPL